MAQQIQLRNGTVAQWTSANPTLAVGELGVETDTNKFKVGTGSTAWNSLAYSVGFTWRGAWSSSTAYTANDLVTYGNASYISIQAGTNQTPGVATSYWTVVVSGSGLAIGGTNTQVQYNNAGLLGGSANLTFNGTTLTTGGLSLKGSTSGTVTITAPATAGTQSYTLPTALPLANDQALTATTSGTLSWSTVSSPAATPTVLGTMYGSMTTSGGTPYLTALGYNAGVVTTGVGNTALGVEALKSNTSYRYNTALGYQAAYSANGSEGTVAIGYRAGYSLVGGNGNTAVGSANPYTTAALQSNVNGDNNTAIGCGSLSSNTVGNNTAVGYESGKVTTTGSNNTISGFRALFSNTTGSYNVAQGTQALYSNSTGQNNTAVGHQALYTNTGNYQSTAVGYQALYSSNATLSSASYNDAFGCQALYSCTTGVGNVAMGSFGYAGSSSALWSCTTGGYNTAIGQGAMRAVTTGGSHTAVGHSAMWNATTGDSNVCIGNSAGYSLTEGSRNVFIGNGTGNGGFGVSGPVTTGSYNIMIGMTACGSSPTVTNAIVIATPYSVQDKGSSTGFISPAGGGVYQGNNSSTWSQTSDERLKKNIVDNITGLEKINGIRVRNFEYRLPEEVDPELKPADAIKKPGIQLGVIAQELQQVLPDCVKQESTGVLAVDPDNLTWYTINAIKELSLQIENLKSQIEELKRG